MAQKKASGKHNPLRSIFGFGHNSSAIFPRSSKPSTLRKNFLGFTLVELVVVIAMIAVFMTLIIAFLDPLKQLEKSRDAVRRHDAVEMKTALDAYYNDHNCYPANIPFGSAWKEGATVYMAKVPQDPDYPNKTYVYKTDASKSCPQWAAIFANLYASDNASVNCPLVSLSSCVPTDYQPTFACSLLGNVDCNYLDSIAVGFPTPAPRITTTPTPTPTPAVHPNIVFITKRTYTGDLGDLSGADSKCQSEATTAGLSGTFRAWLSDSNLAAKDRLSHSEKSFTTVTGTLVANNWNDLTDGSLNSPINIDEYGTLVVGAADSNSPAANTPAWTNTRADGSIFVSGACNNWTNSSLNSTGSYGWASKTNNVWSLASNTGCSASAPSFGIHLYCIEQDSSVPTPTSTPTQPPCSKDYACTGNPSRCNFLGPNSNIGQYCTSNCNGVCQ